MSCLRQPYHWTFSLRLILILPGWKLSFRIFQASTLYVHAVRLFELLVRPLRIIILGSWINEINCSLLAWAGVRLISRIWPLASSMKNFFVPSYYQPTSSWSERRLSIRLNLCFLPLQAAVSGFSGGRRCWSIHTLNTSTISHTQAIWILASWRVAVLWCQTHVMGRGRCTVLLLIKFMRLRKLFAKTNLMTSVF